MSGPDRPTRVTVLYNTDYDAELTSGTGLDYSSVRVSAEAVERALAEVGFTTSLVGIHGEDLFPVVDRLRAEAPDLVFNLCESMGGDARNEPTLAGVLDLFKIRYTGNGPLALGACLHKPRTKDILLGRGVPTPPHRVISSLADLGDPAFERLDYPWFLKLAREDASVGIIAANLVRDVAALRERAAAMLEEFAQPVLAERYVAGREVNVTLIGNDPDVAMLPLHEIDFSSMPPERPRIVSYAAKWDEAHVDYVGTKPVPLRESSPALVRACEQVARASWAALGLVDYGRVDLRVDDSGQPWVIDVNPNPDISPGAGVARAAQATGCSYPRLVERVAMAAWQRYQRESPAPTGPTGR